METVNAIKSIVDQLTPVPSWSYADKYQFNRDADNISFQNANVHLFEIEKGKLNINPNTGSIRDVPQVFMRFLKIGALDNNGDQNRVIIEEMKRLAIKFIVKYNASGIFDVISVSDYLHVINAYDVDGTGVEISFNCKILSPISSCL